MVNFGTHAESTQSINLECARTKHAKELGNWFHHEFLSWELERKYFPLCILPEKQGSFVERNKKKEEETIYT